MKISANNTHKSNYSYCKLWSNGSTLYDFETNKQIIVAVLKFIKDSNRFD